MESNFSCRVRASARQLSTCVCTNCAQNTVPGHYSSLHALMVSVISALVQFGRAVTAENTRLLSLARDVQELVVTNVDRTVTVGLLDPPNNIT